ncbi:hydroxyacid dehydrogenase [bacterium]|nr:hydroxyacid dehydrogenase [bacterium]
MMNALYVLDPSSYDRIYGAAERADIASLVTVDSTARSRADLEAHPGMLSGVEVIMSGWGCPRFDDALLARAPRLKAVFYGAGSIRHVVTDAFWERGIVISSAFAANAVPVAEFTLSQILFCLKRGWQLALGIKRDGAYPSDKRMPGAYESVVGIISLGMVGRRVCELLRPFDLRVIAYDPFAAEETARMLGAGLCGLDELFRTADVVSLHTPWLKETEGMITGAHFAAMKRDAAFINTARGAVVREDEMIAVLRARPDIQAVLDVTHPEPPDPGSPLYSLPNVVLTPHIAGSMEGECRRMGRYMVDELRRFVTGEPLKWQITRERAALLA